MKKLTLRIVIDSSSLSATLPLLLLSLLLLKIIIMIS